MRGDYMRQDFSRPNLPVPANHGTTFIAVDRLTARNLGIDLPGDGYVTLAVAPNRRGKSMTRRSGQSGSVMKKRDKWYGRYYADVPGQNERVRKSVLLGSVEEMGKSQAKRKLLLHLEAGGINSNPVFAESKKQGRTFAQQAEWWQDNKLALCKLSYQEVAMLRLKHMLPCFGSTLVQDIGQEEVQEFITRLSRTTYRPPMEFNISESSAGRLLTGT
jgi:hypothetical protein